VQDRGLSASLKGTGALRKLNMERDNSDLLGHGRSDQLAGANADLAQLVAAAADLCRKPLRHGVVLTSGADDGDCCLGLEVRNAQGERLPEHDLELEIFRSGNEGNARLHLTLAWRLDDTLPMLWQGSHPVWMDYQGLRCERPAEGAQLESLARRLLALLDPDL
jgi:hypothetical protein